MRNFSCVHCDSFKEMLHCIFKNTGFTQYKYEHLYHDAIRCDFVFHIEVNTLPHTLQCKYEMQIYESLVQKSITV